MDSTEHSLHFLTSLSCWPPLISLTFFPLLNFLSIMPLAFSPFITHDLGWKEALESIFTQCEIS